MSADILAQRIIDEVKDRPEDRPLIVFTGGEPFRQNIPLLMETFCKLVRMQPTKNAGWLNEGLFDLDIETNGILLPAEIKLWGDDKDGKLFQVFHKMTLIISPKGDIPQSQIHPSNGKRFALAWKYVISVDDELTDYGYPVRMLGRNTPCYNNRANSILSCVYIQPMDEHDIEKNKANAKLAAEICMKFGYHLSLQVNKYVELP